LASCRSCPWVVLSPDASAEAAKHRDETSHFVLVGLPEPPEPA
jgi:hypothetical protein